MKLAESLQERADLNRKLEELKQRLLSNCLVQEGDAPAEDPKQLLRELDAAADRLRALMAAINQTNSRTVVEGKTLTEWIAEKDVLNARLSIYRALAGEAAQTAPRARGTEIRIVPTLRVAELQKTADALAKRLREVDNLLQATNWTTELIEA